MKNKVTLKLLIGLFLLFSFFVNAQKNSAKGEGMNTDVVKFSANNKDFSTKSANGYLDDKKTAFVTGKTVDNSFEEIKAELSVGFPKEYMFEGFPKVSFETFSNQEVIKFQNIHLEGTEKILTTTYYKKGNNKTISVALTCPLKNENKYTKTGEEAIVSAQVQ